MIEGYTFNGQPYPAEEFAETTKSLLNNNEGILSGINLSNTINSITVSAGRVIVQGRQFAVKGEETVQVESLQTGELYCSLIFEIDMEKEDSASNFEQVQLKVITSASEYPSLTKQDINNGERLYQFEIARFKNSASGIKEFEDCRKFLEWDDILNQLNNDCKAIIENIRKELENVKDGSAYLLKTGGTANGDFTFNGNITADNIVNSNRKQSYI